MMQTIPEQLDVLRFPLQGSRLIEASAGTGKTFTIALLYVRLVLGHGRSDADARELNPPEILVVTFTDAATQELRDRIRARLTEAAEVFRADPATVVVPPAGVDLLQDLRAEYPPEQWPLCARKLQLAAEWMDEAAVSTIHAWCNRMLREHAFDSDSLFTQVLETDQSELQAEVVRDYWRTFFAPLPRAAVDEVRGWWAGPADLENALRKLLDHPDLLEAVTDPTNLLKTRREERLCQLRNLKAPWRGWVEELKSLLDEAVARKWVNGHKIQARYYDPWLAALIEWAGDEEQVWPTLSDSGWNRLTPAGMAEAWKVGAPPDHPAWPALADLKDRLAALPDARIDLLCHAARWVAERFACEQNRRAQMGFNDLLTRLRDALAGPNGERLAGIIRQQFPAALIDEFQDTDPVQWRIFDAVYRVAENDPLTVLVLIGDPKQAIYAFRGADIFTYLQARQACAGRHYTLKRNHRSTQAMVAANNRWFEAAEARASGAGAFLFRDANGNPVPFVSAVAQGREESLVADSAPLPALTVWWLPPDDEGKALAKEVYLEQMAESCASEMVRLLKLGQAGQAGLATAAAPELRPLHPADSAVLVNSRHEADLIRRALARRGVRSVYLSERDSVFQSPQAAELLHWLAACAEPDDPRLLRAALATPTLGQTWAELDTLNRDELAWEARIMQFRDYRECWRRQGVLPMLRRLLGDFAAPSRLLGAAAGGAERAPNGERILTDLLHLAELLQYASTRLEGEHALLRYLAEQIQDNAMGAGADVRQLRLESDADLVQVVTVHKAKGLEYPMVFLPFAGNYRLTKPGDAPLKWHDEDGCLQLGLTADPATLARADRERLGEDIRKFYVALTRARFATWVGIAPLKDKSLSALGYLLNGDDPIGPAALPGYLQALAEGCPHIAIEPAPAPTAERYWSTTETATGLARDSVNVMREHWWVASYSALKKVGDAAMAPETSSEEVFLESRAPPAAGLSPEAAALSATSPDEVIVGLHDFPRGAEAGTFLHDLLEWAANQGFSTLAANVGLLRDTIARRCQVRGWECWIDPLTDWMRQWVATNLQAPADNGMRPATINLGRSTAWLAEMEFWLAVHRTDTRRIDRLVRQHTLGGEPRPALEPGQLNGMLKGFIDLVIEADGRYYVIDYKSNWLGPDAAAYTPAAMREAILRERYELQYVLYLLALHRLLRARLPGYRYEDHIGGAIYLFLRGLDSPSQGLHVERPPETLIEALDALFAQPAAGASS